MRVRSNEVAWLLCLIGISGTWGYWHHQHAAHQPKPDTVQPVATATVEHLPDVHVVHRIDLERATVPGPIRADAIAKNRHPYGVVFNYLPATNPFFLMGLRQGDVILSVNGQDIRTQDDGIKVYLKLKQEHSFDFKVDRHGHIEHIQVEVIGPSSEGPPQGNGPQSGPTERSAARK